VIIENNPKMSLTGNEFLDEEGYIFPTVRKICSIKTPVLGHQFFSLL